MMTLCVPLLAAVLLEQASQPAAKEAEAWRYVLPAPRDAFEHAPFRALVLAREKPDDLMEQASYRGEPSRRRYARIRFGSPASTRVTVVVDTLASGAVDLYVDADRNLKIDDRDRVAGQPAAPGGGRARIWRLPLAVALLEQDSLQAIPRAVVFRLGGSGQTLGFASAGYLEGSVTLGGKSGKPARAVAARRVDGDGNGLLTDAQDRVWIDLNGDGRFDLVDEQFLYASVLNLEGSRYVVLSDALGSRLALQPLVGTGTLRLALNMARGQPRWYKVAKDAAVTIDPIQKPSFEIISRDKLGAAKPGDDFVVRPALYTGDGLLIIVAFCGNPISPATQEILGAKVSLLGRDGKALATAHSGFS
jgi:hypothetical protein